MGLKPRPCRTLCARMYIPRANNGYLESKSQAGAGSGKRYKLVGICTDGWSGKETVWAIPCVGDMWVTTYPDSG